MMSPLRDGNLPSLREEYRNREIPYQKVGGGSGVRGAWARGAEWRWPSRSVTFLFHPLTRCVPGILQPLHARLSPSLGLPVSQQVQVPWHNGSGDPSLRHPIHTEVFFILRDVLPRTLLLPTPAVGPGDKDSGETLCSLGGRGHQLAGLLGPETLNRN